ncbi:hypothetical protein YH65_07510 [Sulfurovum lithotrophicum]|uniref:DUF306 domain-containing protein n=1 Tax=Sulfurovum lithotrophicum TaxID=206403 RepID=A0A7U4M1R1_9BACT|nr:META domain-containing protein [Sulfurovum lithotrophicum]AKF25255.1 hypothetical protein YH65_07510 [Sulfurovum lithotrophicum]
MFPKKLLFISLISTLFFASADSIPLNSLEGSWILRTMDGYKVLSARAILDFHAKHRKIDGYDGCNRIEGKLKLHTDDRYSSKLKTYRYECLNSTKRFVSTRLHQAIGEGFIIQKGKMKDEEGIVLKSEHHTLFFKKLGKSSIIDHIKTKIPGLK